MDVKSKAIRIRVLGARADWSSQLISAGPWLAALIVIVTFASSVSAEEASFTDPSGDVALAVLGVPGAGPVPGFDGIDLTRTTLSMDERNVTIEFEVSNRDMFSGAEFGPAVILQFTLPFRVNESEVQVQAHHTSGFWSAWLTDYGAGHVMPVDVNLPAGADTIVVKFDLVESTGFDGPIYFNASRYAEAQWILFIPAMPPTGTIDFMVLDDVVLAKDSTSRTEPDISPSPATSDEDHGRSKSTPAVSPALAVCLLAFARRRRRT